MSDFELQLEPQAAAQDEIIAIAQAVRKHPTLFLSGDYEIEIVDKGDSLTLLKSGKSTRKRSYEIEVMVVDLRSGDIGPQKADLWLRDAWGRNQDIRKGFSSTIGKVHLRGSGFKGNKVRCGNFSGPSIIVYRVTRV
jgi:hypothetical protein